MRTDEATLSRLVHASLRGDRTAYVGLLRACRPWLERYYARKVPPHQVDDLVQDTLISIHTKLTSFDQARPFLPWLAAVARYRWIDALRRERHVTELDEAHLIDPGEEDAIIARFSIDALLQHLPDKQAEAVSLIKIEGLSVEEAAVRSGQSTALVRVNVHRALRKLAALVESE